MLRRRTRAFLPVLLTLGIVHCSALPTPEAPASRSYADLTALFKDWRQFQQPKRVDGVPDYSPAAMTAQARDLKGFFTRLAAIDPSTWPIPQQVDYYVVRAEMNGLDFDHRVLAPWTNNPAFYVTAFMDESDQPAREGPLAAGGVDLWKYALPLSADDASAIRTGLRVIPKLLAQAKSNLTGNQQDIWTYGTRAMKAQSADLDAFAARIGDVQPDLKTVVAQAKAATDELVSWLDAQASKKVGRSGIGIDNYNWYLENVQLVPYTWEEEVTLMERELARSSASLALEEQRHASLPEQLPIATAAEFDKRSNDAITEYMTFLETHGILSIQPYMDPRLRAHRATFQAGPREFFGEVDARELMLQAGMFDARPRSRELVYILVAERAARALGDLYMHSNRFTLEEASQFASDHTPRGWLSMTGNLVRGEQHLYLQQPAYGTSYVMGKIEADRLITERRRQLGKDFTMKRFMDEFNAAGLVPIALLRWELTGQLPDDVARMLGLRGKV